MKKRSIRFVVFTILLSVFILSNGQLAHANDNDYETDDNADGTVTIIGYKGSSKDVTIPDTLGSKTVTSIGIRAFQSKQLESVTLPPSLTNIGFAAFANNQLESVTLSSSLTSLANHAFSSNQLTSLTITLSTSLTSIGSYAFSFNQLESVTLPSSLTSIDDHAFYNNQLKSVTLPSSLMSIGSYAFNNNQLESVTLPSSLTSIGDYAFSSNQLTSVTVTLPSSLTSIGDHAFNNNQLESVTLPSGLTSIGDHAFNNNQLKSVTLPPSLTSIGDYAFYNSQLKSVTWPSSLTSIGSYAFSRNQLTSVTLPSGLTSIDDGAFSNNQLESVTLPSGLTSVGRWAFVNNPLESVTLPSSLTSIGGSAFYSAKTGHTFAGWFKDTDFETKWDFDKDKVQADMTLYSKWTANKYTVRFVSPGDGILNSMLVDYDKTFIEPSKPTKIGHTFIGWYKESGLTTLWDFATGKVQSDTTLYAKWAVNSPIVTIDHVHAIADIPVPIGTDLSAITFPSSITVTLSDKTTTGVPVTWDTATVVFDGDTPGDYEFTGNLTLPMDVTNPKNLPVKVKVIVRQVGTDTEVPIWPAGSDLSLTGITTTSVQLSWPTATDNIAVTSYRIYVDGVEKATVGNHEQSYVMTGLNAQTTYNFTVRAYDAVGNASMALGKSATTLSSPINPGDSGNSGSGNSDSEPSYVPSSNADLQELKVLLNGQLLTLTPEGSVFTLKTEASEIELFPTTAHSAAKVSLNGKPLVEGQKMPLQKGTNVFELIIEAENGTKKTYTVTIQRTPIEQVAPIVPVEPDPVKPVNPIKPIEFSDTTGHWAEEYIQQAAALGILKGYPDGTFKPNEPLTRAQAVSIIVRALNLQTDEAAPLKDIGNYADETQAEIVAAYQFGIIKGNNGDFKPSDKITRAQIALMIQRAYEYKTGTKYDADKAPYSDFGNYNAETTSAISMLHELGLATGFEGKFNPSDQTTRVHAAKMLVNLLNSLK